MPVPTLNTRVNFMYRDGSNYKFDPEAAVVVSGAFSARQLARIKKSLDDGSYFRHTHVGLPSAFPWERAVVEYRRDDEVDHDFHEFMGLSLTAEPATLGFDIEGLVRAFESGMKQGWTAGGASASLGARLARKPVASAQIGSVAV